MSPKIALLLLFAALAAVPAHAGEPNLRVETAAGPVQGSVHPTTISYRGIPYAEPPLGELRWRSPQPRRPWTAVLDATKFRPHCLQSSLSSDQANASEDCLFLNVYVPRQKVERPLPVMVWIHGGANVVGASDSTDPAPLIEAGSVVVVSLNYRLGPFGFLAHPALDAEDHPAVNYGVMDQQLALKWVRDNIARFGGDPHNVTIFGLSAGGLNVTTHLISPLSAGLFHRAIIQSGSYQLDTPSLKESEALGAAFAERAGCKEQTKDRIAACLRALSAETIVASAGTLTKSDTAVHQSTADGKVLTEVQRVAIEAGRIHRVPVLLGSTSDEERVFGCGALDAMKSFSKWVPTYAYEFADSNASPKGAVHGSDQRYLLIGNRQGSPIDGGPAQMPEDSQRVSAAMRLTWVTFAATGKPHTRLIPEWPLAPKGIQRFEPSMPKPISHAEMSARLKCDALREKNIRPPQ